MKKPWLLGSAVVALVVCVLLVVWLGGSFNLGQFGPTKLYRTSFFWALSTLIFVLVVTLGFLLFREFVKLYIARQSNQQGSRIRTKLVLGALALSCVPVFCLVAFSFQVLSRSLNHWFTNPVQQQVDVFVKAANLLEREMQEETTAQAALLAASPRSGKRLPAGAFPDFWSASPARRRPIPPSSSAPTARPYSTFGILPRVAETRSVRARSPVISAGKTVGYVDLSSPDPAGRGRPGLQHPEVQQPSGSSCATGVKNARLFYTMVMILITLFVLFFTTWIAIFLATPDQRAHHGAARMPRARCARAIWRTAWTSAPSMNWPGWSAPSTR